ncbi:hypothetical protein ABPG72_017005 [Tetrahymena utriculariae]
MQSKIKNLSQNNYSHKDLDRQNANKSPQSMIKGDQETNIIIQDKSYLNENKQNINSNKAEPTPAGGQQKSVEILPQTQKEGQKSLLLDYVQRIAEKSIKIKGSFSYFLNYLKFGKCLKTEQNLLIKKAQEYSKVDLNIYVILDKLQEIQKLKKILFSPEQITLFNFIRKPVIKNENQSSKNIKQVETKALSAKSKFIHQIYLKQMKDQQQQQQAVFDNNPFMKERDTFTTFQAYQNLFDAYKSIKSSGDQKNDIQNQKLFQELGDEIQNIFELQSIISQKNFGNSEGSQAHLETNNQFQMFLQLSPLNKNHRYASNKTKSDSYSFSKYKSEKYNLNGLPIECKEVITTLDLKSHTQNNDKKEVDIELRGQFLNQQKQYQQLFSQHILVNSLNGSKDIQNELVLSQFSNSLNNQESKKLVIDSINGLDMYFKDSSQHKIQYSNYSIIQIISNIIFKQKLITFQMMQKTDIEYKKNGQQFTICSVNKQWYLQFPQNQLGRVLKWLKNSLKIKESQQALTQQTEFIKYGSNLEVIKKKKRDDQNHFQEMKNRRRYKCPLKTIGDKQLFRSKKRHKLCKDLDEWDKEDLMNIIFSDESKIFDKIPAKKKDRCPYHKSKSIKEFFTQNRIEILGWPTFSPDLNIIKDIRAFLKNYLCKNRNNLSSSNIDV